MRTRTKIYALAAALAVAAPVAVSQAPDAAAPAQPARLLHANAAAYADYQGKVSEIMVNKLSSSKDLEKALESFGAPNVNQLSSSWVSYSGILAAQNAELTKSIRESEAAYGRERVLLGLQRDLGYARTLKGGEDALQSILASTSRDAGRISSAGAFVKEQSYTMQRLAWGKEKVKNKDAAVVALKASSRVAKPVTDAMQKLFAGPDLNVMLASISATPNAAENLWDKVSVVAASAPGAAFSAVSPLTVATPKLEVTPEFKGTANRMVTLAALHAIEADQTNGEQVTATMNDPASLMCLEAAQIEMFGCLSAAGSRDEQAFCLARYGLRVPGDRNRSIAGCVSEIAAR